MEKEFILASFPKRFGAWFIDLLIIFLIWYLITISDLNQVDELMKTLDPDIEGSADILATEIFKLYSKFILKWVFVQTMYFTLVPSIIGKGKTIGKLIFRLSMMKRDDLKEISPSRLILREFVGRSLVETVLIIPLIISMILSFVKEGATIHDRISKTIVLSDSSYIEE